VVEPGTDEPLPRRHPAGMRSRPAADRPLELLSVATLNPGKGHEILLQALATLATRPWHLTCAGSLTRHATTTDRVRAMIRRLGLEDRVSLRGELGAASLADCYHDADLFVLATLRETYGMAVAEALAYGLPVVSTTTGAIPALVGDEAGLLVTPGDVDALAGALARVTADGALRARLAAGARRAGARLRRWDQAVEEMAAALARAAGPLHG
jgi:glycosyltransferase involved in cell wall biosynthesis